MNSLSFDIIFLDFSSLYQEVYLPIQVQKEKSVHSNYIFPPFIPPITFYIRDTIKKDRARRKMSGPAIVGSLNFIVCLTYVSLFLQHKHVYKSKRNTSNNSLFIIGYLQFLYYNTKKKGIVKWHRITI